MDVRVRRALSLAVNRQALSSTILGGMTPPASQPVTPAVAGYDPAGDDMTYDPQRARALLAEAGFHNGFSYTLLVATGGGDTAMHQQVAADLAQIGVNVTLRPVAVPQFIRLVQEGGWTSESFVMNYNAERSLDGLRFTRLHSCAARHAWYCNPDGQRLITEAFAEADGTQRLAKTKAVIDFYRRDMPALWLYESFYLTALSKRVTAYQEDFGFIRYDRMQLAPP